MGLNDKEANSKVVRWSFKNDYSEGAHESILQRLVETNLVQQEAYFEDDYSLLAAQAIREKLKNPKAEIYFVAGGTLANLIAISAQLKPFESIIATTFAHIETHEAGAIEARGHKIHTVHSSNGKLTVEHVAGVLEQHISCHMVKPRLVYISNSTEIGTLYQKEEILSLYNFCKKSNLLLYLDGARIGSAVTSPFSNLAFEDLASTVDSFYIGGTKNGALFGEAIVFNNPAQVSNFRHHLKQNGALLAKGRAVGVQFYKLFETNLYFELALHANNLAFKLAEGIRNAGFKFLSEPQSNQIFPILPNKLVAAMENNFTFHRWSKIDLNHTAIRLVTSWACAEVQVDTFLKVLSDNKARSS